MNATHTPGPWHLERNTANSHSSYTYRICQKTGDEDTRRFIGECWHKADARLIAAAPEMRERIQRLARALSTAASYIARDTDTGIADDFESIANDARALITNIDGID
jgi:hypothetical protein